MLVKIQKNFLRVSDEEIEVYNQGIYCIGNLIIGELENIIKILLLGN